VYVATATADDEEMRARIAAHRAARDTNWLTVEEPLELAAVLAEAGRPSRTILVDCLTLWLANLFAAGRVLESEFDRLIDAVVNSPGSVVLISNEVGSGIIPDNQLARRYADALGTLNQRLAGTVDQVVLMTAGLPTLIKPVAGFHAQL